MKQVTEDKNYVYTFIRTDLPIEQQIVQAAHSALEAGREFGTPNTPSHLILLEAKSQYHLERIADELEQKEIRYHMFYEPDDDRGYTSITTEPLTDDSKRKYFSKHSLYRFNAKRSFSTKDEVQFN